MHSFSLVLDRVALEDMAESRSVAMPPACSFSASNWACAASTSTLFLLATVQTEDRAGTRPMRGRDARRHSGGKIAASCGVHAPFRFKDSVHKQ